MLPPTDSLQHQLLKLIEITSTTTPNNQPPPPAYTPHIAAAQGEALYEDSAAEVDDEYDYDHDHLSPPRSHTPAAITININGSLKIEGHGNTIVLPVQATSSSSLGGSSRSNSSASAGIEQPASPPFSSGPNSRASKLTTIILTALKDAGVFDSDNSNTSAGGSSTNQHERKRRPINLNIDAGIVLKGNRNMVCQGGRGHLLPHNKSDSREAGAAAARDETTRKAKLEAGTGLLMAHGDGGSESRKRRPCSEPPELINNTAKRIRALNHL